MCLKDKQIQGKEDLFKGQPCEGLRTGLDDLFSTVEAHRMIPVRLLLLFGKACLCLKILKVSAFTSKQVNVIRIEHCAPNHYYPTCSL